MTGFAEYHAELRAVARDLLGRAAPLEPGGSAEPAAGWELLAQSGWLALEVPEALGGAGATFAEVALIAREMGRAVSPHPYLGSVVLGNGLLGLLRPSPGRDELMAAAASGECRLAVAMAVGEDGAAATPYALRTSGTGLIVDGAASFVPDAAGADRLLLPATDPDGAVVVAAVERSRPGLEVTAQDLVDPTRHLASVTAFGVEVDGSSVWPFAGDPREALDRLAGRGVLAVACDSLGLAEAVMEASVRYAGARSQFGRAIGSFQAVKHACADMSVEIAVCSELVAAAVDGVAEEADDAWVAVSQAKAHVTEAAVSVAGKAMQLHGGIGYTWESGIHLYLKRAALNRSLFGSPAGHRRRLAARYL